MNNKVIGFFVLLVVLFQISFVFAGVGIKWDKESALINENDRTCLTYYVYNPWNEDTTVKVELSDETGDLNSIVTEQESETKLVPANTSSKDALPIEFCFSAPEIYERDCLVGGLMCELVCEGDQREYVGEVVVKSVPEQTEIGGAGGSTTTMSVSAPLKIKVRCNPYERNYTVFYALIAVLCLIVITLLIYRKYKGPKSRRKK